MTSAIPSPATTAASLDLPPIATLEDESFHDSVDGRDSSPSLLSDQTSALQDRSAVSPTFGSTANSQFRLRFPVPTYDVQIPHLEQAMCMDRWQRTQYPHLCQTVQRLCTEMAGQDEDRIVKGIVALHPWIEKYENFWPVRTLVKDALLPKAPQLPASQIASSSKIRSTTVHLSQNAKNFLIDYFNTVNTNPRKQERLRLVDEVRRIDGLKEEYNESKLNSWFVARRRMTREQPELDAISDADAHACFSALEENTQKLLKALFTPYSKQSPTMARIVEWADLLKAEVNTVRGAVVHLRNDEKAKHHHQKSYTLDVKEIRPFVSSTTTQAPPPTREESPPAREESRSIPAETHLPTPAVSVSPEPAPRVPAMLTSGTALSSPTTRPVPPPLNTSFSTQPQPQPPSSSSTSAPSSTPITTTSYTWPPLAFSYPTDLPWSGSQATGPHHYHHSVYQHGPLVPSQLPSPVETRTVKPPEIKETPPPVQPIQESTVTAFASPPLKSQVSPPPKEVVEPLCGEPMPMDIDIMPMPPPPLSLDDFLAQTESYDAILERMFNKTSNGELKKWEFHPDMLPPLPVKP